MESDDPARKAETGPSRAVAVAVWATWAMVLLVVLAAIGRYGRNVPLAEDWLVVPALTGHEPDLGAWLWMQNNEHRLPLPRLLLLGLFVATRDFRAGMIVSALSLGAMAFVMISTARRLRRRTAIADAFFPLVLLHLGHGANLFMSWQLQFVASTLLSCGLLIMVVQHRRPLSLRSAAVAGTLLCLLPFCGANGLAFVPGIAVWFVYLAWRGGETDRRARRIMLASAGLAAALVVAYYAGYEPVAWYQERAGPVATAKTALKLVAMGFGPAGRGDVLSWTDLPAIAVLGLTVAVLTWRAWTCQGERERSLGLLAFLGGIGALTVGIAYGRAAVVPEVGLPARYSLLVAPAFCAAFFVWEVYGPARTRVAVPLLLLVLSLAVLPRNTRSGLEWGRWYRNGMQRVIRDIDAGLTPSQLAERHYSFLLRWDREGLERMIRMLQHAGIGPFARAREPALSVSGLLPAPAFSVPRDRALVQRVAEPRHLRERGAERLPGPARPLREGGVVRSVFRSVGRPPNVRERRGVRLSTGPGPSKSAA